MAVVVTGASGFVGGNLVKALLERGEQVRTPIHQEQEREMLEGLDVEIVYGDVRDPESLRRAFDGAELVYHLAAHISLLMSDWPVVKEVNVTGTRHVVEACLDRGVLRLVHCSSFHALVQEPLDLPLDESRPLLESPRKPPYGRSKAGGEKEIQKGIAQGLDAVILSPTGIIGPDDRRPSYFGEILLRISHGKMPLIVEGGCNWVDVRDVVEGILRAAEQAATGAKYLLSGHYVSLADLAALVGEITGVRPPRIVLPMWLAHIYAPFNTAFNLLAGKSPRLTPAALQDLSDNPNVSYERAARDLGYSPRPFKQTLLDTLRWFWENGHLERSPVLSI